MSVAPISTYIGHFFSGTADPSTPHLILILAAVMGGLAVGIGIILEAARGGHLWTLPTAFVFLGVVIEAGATVILFEFDEGISHAQQSKIIALETRIAPRVLTKEQYDAIQTLRGKVRAVSVLSSPDIKPAMFSAQLQVALDEAGVSVTPVPAPSGVRYVGTQICLPKNEAPNDSPLWETFSAIGLTPALCSLESITLPVAKDAPLIIIGTREPFFPGGAPRSLRFRAYPGLDITRKQQ